MLSHVTICDKIHYSRLHGFGLLLLMHQFWFCNNRNILKNIRYNYMENSAVATAILPNASLSTHQSFWRVQPTHQSLKGSAPAQVRNGHSLPPSFVLEAFKALSWVCGKTTCIYKWRGLLPILGYLTRTFSGRVSLLKLTQNKHVLLYNIF